MRVASRERGGKLLKPRQSFWITLYIRRVQPTRCNVSQFISVRLCTCFRGVFRPSSGAQNCTYSVRHLSDRYYYLLRAWMGWNFQKDWANSTGDCSDFWSIDQRISKAERGLRVQVIVTQITIVEGREGELDGAWFRNLRCQKMKGIQVGYEVENHEKRVAKLVRQQKLSR